MSPPPAKRPSNMPPARSPLSPRMDSLAVPVPQNQRPRPAPHGRQHSTGTAAVLRLPSLPRFHPANFPSQSSSAAATPATGPNSPQPPLSPRAYQRQYSEAAQKQFLLYHSQINPNRQARGSTARPTSPRLNPTGSPGPVTPLELERADGYLTAGVNTDDATSHVDKLIREEARRRGEISPGRPTSVGGR